MGTDRYQIDDGAGYVGYRKAFDLICSSIRPMGIEEISLEMSINRTAAEDVAALATYPSADISLKDGFAVRSKDVVRASRQRPAILKVIGSAFAGSRFKGHVRSGSVVKICSGAPIPAGAGAVVSSEFCEETSEHEVHIRADATVGRNILRTGAEVKAGVLIVRAGDVLLPRSMALAASAGISKVRVYQRPKVALLCVGNEVVFPGKPLRPGQVYASNLITLKAWLNSFGIDCVYTVVRDDVNAIRLELEKRLCTVDVILTSGGVWGSERDLVIAAFAELGWQKIFHHVRMGPGKAIGFGLWNDKPVFCLPGGPASNEMAFLQLALPGILRMSGDGRPRCNPYPPGFLRA